VTEHDDFSLDLVAADPHAFAGAVWTVDGSCSTNLGPCLDVSNNAVLVPQVFVDASTTFSAVAFTTGLLAPGSYHFTLTVHNQVTNVFGDAVSRQAQVDVRVTVEPANTGVLVDWPLILQEADDEIVGRTDQSWGASFSLADGEELEWHLKEVNEEECDEGLDDDCNHEVASGSGPALLINPEQADDFWTPDQQYDLIVGRKRPGTYAAEATIVLRLQSPPAPTVELEAVCHDEYFQDSMCTFDALTNADFTFRISSSPRRFEARYFVQLDGQRPQYVGRTFENDFAITTQHYKQDMVVTVGVTVTVAGGLRVIDTVDILVRGSGGCVGGGIGAWFAERKSAAEDVENTKALIGASAAAVGMLDDEQCRQQEGDDQEDTAASWPEPDTETCDEILFTEYYLKDSGRCGCVVQSKYWCARAGMELNLHVLLHPDIHLNSVALQPGCFKYESPPAGWHGEVAYNQIHAEHYYNHTESIECTPEQQCICRREAGTGPPTGPFVLEEHLAELADSVIDATLGDNNDWEAAVGILGKLAAATPASGSGARDGIEALLQRKANNNGLDRGVAGSAIDAVDALAGAGQNVKQTQENLVAIVGAALKRTGEQIASDFDGRSFTQQRLGSDGTANGVALNALSSHVELFQREDPAVVQLRHLLTTCSGETSSLLHTSESYDSARHGATAPVSDVVSVQLTCEDSPITFADANTYGDVAIDISNIPDNFVAFCYFSSDDGATWTREDHVSTLESISTTQITCRMTDRTGHLAVFQEIVPTTANWNVGTWSSCSAQCGTGTQTRTSTCSTNNDADCDQASKPASEQQSCTVRACEWQNGAWAGCTATCGEAEVERLIVSCETGTDADCLGDKPTATFRSCGLAACEWQFGTWSVCSVACGTGQQTRSVSCETGTDDQCAADKPPAIQVCEESCESVDPVNAGPFQVKYKLSFDQETFANLSQSAKTALGQTIASVISGATFVEWQTFSGRRRLVASIDQVAVLNFDSEIKANQFRASVVTTAGAAQLEQSVQTSIQTSGNVQFNTVNVSAPKQDVDVVDTTPVVREVDTDSEKSSMVWIVGPIVGAIAVFAFVAFLVRRRKHRNHSSLSQRAQDRGREMSFSSCEFPTTNDTNIDMEFGKVPGAKKSRRSRNGARV
jgi:hypothetical protein